VSRFRLVSGAVSGQDQSVAEPAIDISSLSPDQRLDLIGELWDSLGDTDVPLTSAQQVELERRLASFDKTGPRGVGWPEVAARIRKQER
jgi:putative addiction module component (TIGR02574 family)